MSLCSIHRHSRATTTRSLGPFATILISARSSKIITTQVLQVCQQHSAYTRPSNSNTAIISPMSSLCTKPLCPELAFGGGAHPPSQQSSNIEYHETAPSENNHCAGSHASASPLITTAVTLQPSSLMVIVIKRWFDAA